MVSQWPWMWPVTQLHTQVGGRHVQCSKAFVNLSYPLYPFVNLSFHSLGTYGYMGFPVHGFWSIWSSTCYFRVVTNNLWLFNIAMENGPFIDEFPSYKPPFILGIFHGYVSHNQMVTPQPSFIHQQRAVERRSPLGAAPHSPASGVSPKSSPWIFQGVYPWFSHG